MSKFKWFIFCIVLIILIILIILILLLRNQDNRSVVDNIVYNGEELIPEKDSNGYIDVSNFNVFYSIMNAVNKYVENIKYNDNYNINDESVGEKNLNKIYALLDKNYINNNKINFNNIKNYIYDMNENTKLIPIQMKVKYGENINIYILKAYLIRERIEEKYFIIRVDTKNQTFSIEFINEDVNSIEQLNVYENNNEIQKNNYNSFSIEMMTVGRMMQCYLEHYRDLSINYPEIVYNEYLDEDYKNKRFGTLENYKKYINDNIEELQNIDAKDYLVETDDNNINYYVCLDQYNNTYIFNILSVYQYKIKLDDYTLTSNKFIQTYNSSNNQKKVMMNVNKLINMLNSRDYNTAYELLDENFRSEKFGGEENFEEYIKRNFPSHYKIKYESYEQTGNNVFVQKITLLDIIDNTDYLSFSIIMVLKNESDFSISFGLE